MSFDTEREQFETLIESGLIAGIPVSTDAQKFEVNTTPCVNMTIQSGEAFQMSYGAPGSNLVRYAGVTFFEIYTGGGAGSVQARVIAEDIKDLYRNQNLGTVHIKIPYIHSTRIEEPHYIIVLAVPFHRDAFEA